MQSNWIKTQTAASVPGKDYPQTWNEFLDWSASEDGFFDS